MLKCFPQVMKIRSLQQQPSCCHTSSGSADTSLLENSTHYYPNSFVLISQQYFIIHLTITCSRTNRTLRFNTVYQKKSHCIRTIFSTSSHPTSLRSILTLSSNSLSSRPSAESFFAGVSPPIFCIPFLFPLSQKNFQSISLLNFTILPTSCEL
jgi:hypothetical protein